MIYGNAVGGKPINKSYERYEGAYEVIPAVTEQTLETENKIMVADVEIKKIPYYEVTNAANGTTVTIAELNP